MPQRNGYKSHRGRSGVARKVQFGGPSGTDGIMPNVVVPFDSKQVNAFRQQASSTITLYHGTGPIIPDLSGDVVNNLTADAGFALYLSPTLPAYITDSGSSIPNPRYAHNIATYARYFKTTPNNVVNVISLGSGTAPNVTVQPSVTSTGIQTSYFGGPKKGGAAPSATGFMIPSNPGANYIPAPAQRPNYLFRFTQKYSKGYPGAGGPLL